MSDKETEYFLHSQTTCMSRTWYIAHISFWLISYYLPMSCLYLQDTNPFLAVCLAYLPFYNLHIHFLCNDFCYISKCSRITILWSIRMLVLFIRNSPKSTSRISTRLSTKALSILSLYLST